MGFVEGFEPALMEEKNDCGPVALRQALGCSGVRVELRELKRVWGWSGSDLLDTPWAHARAMKRLGVGFSMRIGWTADEALAEVQKGRPVVLLLRRGLARFHWVVACGEEERKLLVSTGKGVEAFARERLDSDLPRGLVPLLLGCRRLGYVVGRGEGEGACPACARILGRACSVLSG